MTAEERSSHSAWLQAKNVLCVRLDTLGDVLMTTPAIRAVKESLPGRTVTLLTSPPGAAPIPYIPEIDDVIVYEAPWMKATPPRATSDYDHTLIYKLKQRGFDAAVIFTVYSQNPLPSALLCYLADIPLRLAHARENPYQLLTDRVRETEPDQQIRHEVQRQLDLVAAVGCASANPRLSFHPTPQDCLHVLDRLRAVGIDLDRPWLALHPGASATSRRYPAEKYAAVIHRLAWEDGIQIVLTGSTEEIPLVESIRRDCGVPVVSLTGLLHLGELGALIQLAPILITNNTGPAHIAAAVGTPVVDLYALTNPQHTPWNVPSRVLSHNVPCRNCYRSICPEGHHLCLEGVLPEEVVRAALELLAITEKRSERNHV